MPRHQDTTANESVSGRAYRENWKLRKAINTLFFWQEDHCKMAYENDVQRARDLIAAHDQEQPRGPLSEMQTPDKVEAALQKVADSKVEGLTPDEIKAVRSVLEWWRTWQAWGKLGRIVLWGVITMGAIAAALREVKVWLQS